MSEGAKVATGISQLDNLLGGLFIGDNVIWYDDAGSLASVFYLNFIRASQEAQRPLIYVTFDRSPKSVLQKLGPLADYPGLIILDAFTWGKGAGSDVFLRFYEQDASRNNRRLIPVKEPRQIEQFMGILFGVHSTLEGDVRFVFESLTGMQELWGGEDEVLSFYSHSCPRLFELKTIAYWVMEKGAHSSRLRAAINQIAQVVIDLSIRRGTTNLTVIKAENRELENMHKPQAYSTHGQQVFFGEDGRAPDTLKLGRRIKTLRSRRGLSQSELARLVGVTPSNISQVEGNHIHPSLPALIKMAEVLGVEAGAFFQETDASRKRLVFGGAEAVEVRLRNLPEGLVKAELVLPREPGGMVEMYLLEIAPNASIPHHFFQHKGAELGYLLQGRLQMHTDSEVHELGAGDAVQLFSEMPDLWVNPDDSAASLLWLKLK